MSLTVRRYEGRDAEAWDALVSESWNGTLLHKRRFLSYHGERFRDLSLVVEDRQGKLAGVLPAALDPTRGDVVVSHPGITYGGVVHAGGLQGMKMLEVLRGVCETYRGLDLRKLRYKAVPHVYHRVPCGDDFYALFRLGARRYRCDLSAAVDLSSDQELNQGRRSALSKARRSGVEVSSGARYLRPFWAVLEEVLADRHEARPVHTLEEIELLQSRFPEEMKCIVGTMEDEVVCGVLLFRAPGAAHVQYSASNEAGNAVDAQTAVVAYAIEKSRDLGERYFDFGISNEEGGEVLNEGLYRFKTSFGAGGVVHEFYELELENGDA